MLKTLFRAISALACVAFLGGPPAFAQLNTLTATTLAAAVASGNQTFVQVTSATNINAPNLQSSTVGSQLYVVAPGNTRGEVMPVTGVNGTTISVRRNNAGAGTTFPSGSLVLVGQPNWFYDYDPSGGCSTATVFVSPWVNTKTGDQWLCSSITLSWVPGFGNRLSVDGAQVTAAVASAAALPINGPLQHVTGTTGATSFVMGPGWNGQGFCLILDGVMSPTAGNNIGLGTTGVVKKTLCYTWDATNSWFDPSY